MSPMARSTPARITARYAMPSNQSVLTTTRIHLMSLTNTGGHADDCVTHLQTTIEKLEAECINAKNEMVRQASTITQLANENAALQAKCEAYDNTLHDYAILFPAHRLTINLDRKRIKEGESDD